MEVEREKVRDENVTFLESWTIFFMDGNGKTTPSQVKVWFIIQPQ